MDRRKFLKTSSALCGIGVIGTAIIVESCNKNSNNSTPQGPTVNFTLDLTTSSNLYLNSAGGSVASNGVVVVNNAGTFYAVAQACTHAGCSVTYNAGTIGFICPCHNGTYDINGKVLSGPPPAPLKKYTVTKSGNILTIVG